MWVSSELKVDAEGFSALSESSSTSAAELGLSDGRSHETLVQYCHCDCLKLVDGDYGLCGIG